MKSFYLIVGLGAVAVFSIGMAAAQNISISSNGHYDVSANVVEHEVLMLRLASRQSYSKYLYRIMSLLC
jgi:hypothetical protein